MDDLISLNTTKDKLETITTGPSLGGEDEDRQSDGEIGFISDNNHF